MEYSKYVLRTVTQTIDDRENVIIIVDWLYTGNDGTDKYSVIVSTPIEYNPESFIPFSELTEEQVLGFVDGYTTEEQYIDLKAQIDVGLNNIKSLANRNSPNLPWI